MEARTSPSQHTTRYGGIGVWTGKRPRINDNIESIGHALDVASDDLVAIPVTGGLHHRYERVAA